VHVIDILCVVMMGYDSIGRTVRYAQIHFY
jgi:hypothetical protein